MNQRASSMPTQPRPSGRGAAVPLVTATLHGILPHGSEVPRGPIPLRSADLDDSPCLKITDMGFVQNESLFPTGGRHAVTPPSPAPDSQPARPTATRTPSTSATLAANVSSASVAALSATC